jgi:hypothetical protein
VFVSLSTLGEIGTPPVTMKKLSQMAQTSMTAPSWIFVVIGLIMGQTSWANTLLSTIRGVLQYYLVPTYTVLVLLYLSYAAFRIPLEPLLNSLKALFVPKEVTPPVPAEVTALPSSTAASLEDQPFDLSGAYKLQSNNNFEGFLAVQGVPWALRRAANQARPVHRITHRGSQLTIKIEGIIESQTTYIIHGPPVETNVRGRIFEDAVTYLEDGVTGIIVRKRALTENYDVSVQRVLSEDKQQITMTSTASFHDEREAVQCIQLFKRVE